MIVGTAILNALRSSVDFPYTLGARLKGWWVFDEGDVTQSSGLISQVRDRGAGGWHATQSGPLAKLEFDDVLYFGGVGAALGSGGQYMAIPSGYAATMSDDEWLVWAVIQTDDETTTQCFFSTGTTTGNNGYELTCDGSGTAKFGVRVAPIGVAENGDANTNPHLIVATRVSGIMHFIVDDMEVALADNNAPVVDPDGASWLAAISPAAWHLVGALGEAGGSSPLSGLPGVGNQVTGELLQLWQYVSARYTI